MDRTAFWAGKITEQTERFGQKKRLKNDSRQQLI